jgi:hypothetical protein
MIRTKQGGPEDLELIEPPRAFASLITRLGGIHRDSEVVAMGSWAMLVRGWQRARSRGRSKPYQWKRPSAAPSSFGRRLGERLVTPVRTAMPSPASTTTDTCHGEA